MDVITFVPRVDTPLLVTLTLFAVPLRTQLYGSADYLTWTTVTEHAAYLWFATVSGYPLQVAVDQRRQTPHTYIPITDYWRSYHTTLPFSTGRWTFILVLD